MGSPSWSASDVAMVPRGREFYHSNPLGILLERQLDVFYANRLPVPSKYHQYLLHVKHYFWNYVFLHSLI